MLVFSFYYPEVIILSHDGSKRKTDKTDSNNHVQCVQFIYKYTRYKSHLYIYKLNKSNHQINISDEYLEIFNFEFYNYNL